MTNENYQNFIYLFNDENFINVKQNNIYPQLNNNMYAVKDTFSEYLSALDFGPFGPGYSATDNTDSTSRQIYIPGSANASAFADYPRYGSGNPITVRTKQTFLVSTKGSSLLGTTALPLSTNDPFRSPHKRIFFDLDNSNASLVKKLPLSDMTMDGYITGAPFLDNVPGFALMASQYRTEDITEYRYGVIASEVATVSPFSAFTNPEMQETGKDFLYSQLVPVAFTGGSYEGGIDLDLAINYYKEFLSYFVRYGNGMLTTGGTRFKSFSVKDISTAIGVPYDIEAVLGAPNVMNKSYGRMLQPQYEKIYNYYDPQYEPLVEAILDQDVIDERSLPSIYDFLYLDANYYKTANSSFLTFLGLPPKEEAHIYMDGALAADVISPESINLSNLNQYLDVFASYYAGYLQLEIDGITIQGLIGEKYFDEGYNALIPKGKPNQIEKLNGEYEKYAGKAQIFTSDDMIELNKIAQENSKVDWTPKTALLKQLEAIDPLELISSKSKAPLWVQELKAGIYFSENGLKTFNQTLDKDSVFPFLVKINIPTEQKGPIANIFSQVDMLDAINTYAASITTPSEFDFPLPVTVGDFYGGVINGAENENINLFSDAKMLTFKMYLENEPATPNSADLKLLRDILGSESEIKEEFINLFGVLLQAELTQFIGLSSLDEYLDSFIAAVLEAGVSKEMSEFLQTLQAAPGTEIPIAIDNSITIKEVIKTFQSMKFTRQEYGVDLYLDTLFSVGNGTLKNVFVYTDEDEPAMTSELSLLVTQLKVKKLKSLLKEALLQKKLLRSPVDVQNGEFAHQETLMYEIAKYGFDEEGNEKFIQSFFLPITDNVNLNYYDTQIIPRKKYHYKIFVHKVIVGTDYKFVPAGDLENVYNVDALKENVIKKLGPEIDGGGGEGGNIPGIDGPNNSKTQFYQSKYEVKPYLQFVRVPYYNVSLVNTKNDEINYTIVEDKPPLPPLVNFVPYRGVNNKILVLMNNSIGEIEQHPIIMFEEDKQIIMDAGLAQDKIYSVVEVPINGETIQLLGGPPMEYKSDDQEGTFQAYRIVNEPTSYIDFERDQSLKVFELSVEGNFKNDSFLDDIAPNVDYYYTFRFQDIHGRLSNPTEVYKVRMEQGAAAAPYLKIRVLDILQNQVNSSDEKLVTFKTAQKYVMIRPSDNQNNVSYAQFNGLALDYDENGFPINPGAGYESVKVTVGDQGLTHSVFGQKFKLRITSKQTGKKIDINFTVKQPEDVVNETGNIQYEKT